MTEGRTPVRLVDEIEQQNVNHHDTNICPQSQRDYSLQPRVGATAPTLGGGCKNSFNPNGVASSATLSGLVWFVGLTQGSSQARNPGLKDGIPSGFNFFRCKMRVVNFVSRAAELCRSFAKRLRAFLPLRVGGVSGADGEQRQRTWRVRCFVKPIYSRPFASIRG
jgi:hypothetical protein